MRVFHVLCLSICFPNSASACSFVIVCPIFTGTQFKLVNPYQIVGTHALSRYAFSLNHSLDAIYDAVSPVNVEGNHVEVPPPPPPVNHPPPSKLASIGFHARSTASNHAPVSFFL